MSIELTGYEKGPEGALAGAISRVGHFRGNLLGLFLVLSVSLVLVGCAGTGTMQAPSTQADYGSGIAWPFPPEKARIAFVRTLEKPSDLGRGKGLLKGILEVILGPKQERVIKPFGIAVDNTGRVIVADTAFRRLHIFDIKKKKYKGLEISGDEKLISPVGVAVDINDNIYVSDSAAGKVYAMSPRGRLFFEFTGFTRPTGIAIDNTDQLLYVVDTGAHMVKVFSLNGDLLRSFGLRGGDEEEFNFPVDIFVDKDGLVYVSDSMNFRIQIFSKEGRFLRMFGKNGDSTGSMARPKGVAVDRDGNIYVADAIFDTIQIFSSRGDFLLNFGTKGSGPRNFWMPSGIFIDERSFIYVADSYNRRVQVFEYLGGD